METQTTMRKQDLLDILNENRSKHRQVFEASLEGYAAEAKKALRAQLRALSQGRTPQIRIVLSRPEDHTRDYDRVIRMLELDIAMDFTMTERMFAQYVMDDWQWKRDWLRMSSQYASASTQAAYAVELEDDDYA